MSQDQLDALKPQGVVDDNGMLLDGTGKQPLIDATKADFSDKRLSGFFADADATALSAIREALELGLKIQVDLATKLLRMRDELANATLLGVSTLAGAPPDRTLAVLQHPEQCRCWLRCRRWGLPGMVHPGAGAQHRQHHSPAVFELRSADARRRSATALASD